MKLHLPKMLKCALLACMAMAAQVGAFTINQETTTQSLSADFNVCGVSYNAESGILTGLDTSAITFVLNNTALISAESIAANTGLLYVRNSSDSYEWGFNVNNDKGILGHWIQPGSTNSDWTTNYTVTQTTLANRAVDGQVTLTAKITNSGTYLYPGTSASGTSLYDKSGLRAGSETIASVYANKDYISSITYNGENLSKDTAHVVAGSVTKDYATWANNTISNTAVAATMLINGRTQINGGDGHSAATLNTNGGDIWVGKTGQLYLQTWGQGAITLDHDIYLGTSTFAGTGSSTADGYGAFGALRFGNDGNAAYTTNLNGNIVLVENSAMGSVTEKAKAVNINGKVRGGYELTFRQGKGVSFKGGIDIKKLTVEGGEIAIDSALKLSGDLALRGGVINLGAGTHEVSVLDGAVSGNAVGTLNIASGAQLTVNSSIWSRSASNINIEEGGSIKLGTITLTGLAAGDTPSIATTSGNAQFGLGNNTFTLSNVELALGEAQTITAGLNNVVLNAGSNAVTLNTDAVLTGLEISQALTINSGKTVTLNGTANYTGTTSTREVALTSGNGYGTVETYAQVINGAGALTGTTTWTYNGQATTSYNNGELITGTATSSIYYVNDATADIDVVAGEKFQIKSASDITVNSGTLDYANITAGQNNINSVTLAGEASLVKGIFTLTGDGASITPVAGHLFDIAQTGSSVGNGTATITADGNYDVTFYNKLEDVNLTYTNTAVQDKTLKLNNENTLGNVTMNSGATLEIVGGSTAISGTATLNDVIVDSNASLTFSETEQTIGALTLHNGATVTLGTEESHDAALHITGLTVTGADAVMNADLVMNSGTLTFANDAVLTMGCTVSIGDDVTVVLTQEMVDSIATGNWVEIIANVEGIATLGQHARFEGADFELAQPTAYHLTQIGDKIYITPEPATTTLSLLALAALAARRKRH